MHTEFRKAVKPDELSRLMAFDRKAFHQYPSDWFYREDWQSYESWWLLVNRRRVGCCAFQPHVDFEDDISPTGANPRRQGSLCIVSTGIHPSFRGKGLGTLFKAWQISYARFHGFERIVTNTRKSNRAMLALNRKFGFRILRTTPAYYVDPSEATIVLELRLGSETSA